MERRGGDGRPHVCNGRTIERADGRSDSRTRGWMNVWTEGWMDPPQRSDGQTTDVRA